MTKRVYKYVLQITDHQDITMPEGAQLLHVAEQGADLTLWALVDTDASLAVRCIYVHGTGHRIDHSLPYLGTVLDSRGLVWHIFDGGEFSLPRDSAEHEAALEGAS